MEYEKIDAVKNEVIIHYKTADNKPKNIDGLHLVIDDRDLFIKALTCQWQINQIKKEKYFEIMASVKSFPKNKKNHLEVQENPNLLPS